MYNVSWPVFFVFVCLSCLFYTPMATDTTTTKPTTSTTTTWPPTTNSTTTTTTTTTHPTTTPTPKPYPSTTVICKNVRKSHTARDWDNFGDIVCDFTDIPSLKSHELLTARETVLNDYLVNASKTTFKRDLPSILVTKVNVLNFGRQHGFARNVTISNDRHGGSVKVHFEIAARKEMRAFVEIYGTSAFRGDGVLWPVSMGYSNTLV